MFICMDKNNNKYPEWIDYRFKEVFNPFFD